MNEIGTQRLSQDDKCAENEICGILEQAESVAGGVLESIQALARTKNCKGVQIAQLAKWAKTHNCWIDKSELGSYVGKGDSTFELKREEELSPEIRSLIGIVPNSSSDEDVNGKEARMEYLSGLKW